MGAMCTKMNTPLSDSNKSHSHHLRWLNFLDFHRCPCEVPHFVSTRQQVLECKWKRRRGIFSCFSSWERRGGSVQVCRCVFWWYASCGMLLPVEWGCRDHHWCPILCPLCRRGSVCISLSNMASIRLHSSVPAASLLVSSTGHLCRKKRERNVFFNIFLIHPHCYYLNRQFYIQPIAACQWVLRNTLWRRMALINKYWIPAVKQQAGLTCVLLLSNALYLCFLSLLFFPLQTFRSKVSLNSSIADLILTTSTLHMLTIDSINTGEGAFLTYWHCANIQQK